MVDLSIVGHLDDLTKLLVLTQESAEGARKSASASGCQFSLCSVRENEQCHFDSRYSAECRDDGIDFQLPGVSWKCFSMEFVHTCFKHQAWITSDASQRIGSPTLSKNTLL